MSHFVFQPDAYKPSISQARLLDIYLNLLELKGTERILDLGCGNGKISSGLV